MEEVLKYISSYGVLPILIYIIYYLHKELGNAKEDIKQKYEEIRNVEKENLAITYKLIAIVNKLEKEENKDDDNI